MMTTLSFLSYMLFPAVFFGCPNCKDFLATESAMALGEGYYWSILLMVTLPFLLTGSVAAFIILSFRKKKKSA